MNSACHGRSQWNIRKIPLWGPLGTKLLNPPKGIPSGETN